MQPKPGPLTVKIYYKSDTPFAIRKLWITRKTTPSNIILNLELLGHFWLFPHTHGKGCILLLLGTTGACQLYISGRKFIACSKGARGNGTPLARNPYSTLKLHDWSNLLSLSQMWWTIWRLAALDVTIIGKLSPIHHASSASFPTLLSPWLLVLILSEPQIHHKPSGKCQHVS